MGLNTSGGSLSRVELLVIELLAKPLQRERVRPRAPLVLPLDVSGAVVLLAGDLREPVRPGDHEPHAAIALETTVDIVRIEDPAQPAIRDVDRVDDLGVPPVGAFGLSSPCSLSMSGEHAATH
ncbi:MAG TPA: hypothetical protein VGF94_24815, partial [Kofleriaceae bacterium]